MGQENKLSEILNILDQEKAALLSGRLDLVEGLSERKLQEISRLDGRLSPCELETCMKLIRHNMNLIKSIRNGIEIVNDRIGALKKIEYQDQFYGHPRG